jgi:hypothetical protein
MSPLVRLALLGLVALAGPLAAAPVPLPAKYDPPSAIGQTVSVQKLLEHVTGTMKAFSPDSADGFEKGLADLLGEKGWAGLDAKKPVGLYAYLKPKLDESYVVFAVPITKEKEAIDLLERLGAGLEEEANAKGVYAVHWRGVLPPGATARVRFHDGHAYLGLNADAAALAPAKLLPVSSLVDDKETAPAVVTLFPGRLPNELKEIMDGWWASGKAGLDQMEERAQPGMPKGFPAFAKACVGWADGNTAALFKDAETFTLRLNYDPKTVDAAAVMTVVPKAKSALAADIEKLKPAQGRFHQLVTKDAVGGVWLRVGGAFPKEVRAKAGPFLSDWIGLMSAGEEVQPLLAELGKAVNKSVTEGNGDAGVALLAADKSGAHTAILAVAVADPAALEKVARKMAADLPKEAQGMIKLDAEKAGELSVHTFAVPEESGLEGVFGKKTVVRLAFGKDAVYLAIGPDGLEQIKRAAALKPADAKQFDLVVNPAKVHKLVTDLGGGGGNWLDAMLGKEDGLRSYCGVEVKGGKELTITYTQHRLGLLFGAFFALRIG